MVDPSALQQIMAMFGGQAAGGGGQAQGGGAMPSGNGIGDFFASAGKIKSARAPNPFTGQGGAMAVNMQGKPLNQRTGQTMEEGGQEGSAAGDMGESFGNFARQMLRRREGGSV